MLLSMSILLLLLLGCVDHDFSPNFLRVFSKLRRQSQKGLLQGKKSDGVGRKEREVEKLRCKCKESQGKKQNPFAALPVPKVEEHVHRAAR